MRTIEIKFGFWDGVLFIAIMLQLMSISLGVRDVVEAIKSNTRTCEGVQ